MTPEEIRASRRQLAEERLATIDSQTRELRHSIESSGNPDGLFTRVQVDRLNRLFAESLWITEELRSQ